MARGNPGRIASLVEPALVAWSMAPGDADASEPAPGLLARALLRQLECGTACGEAPPCLLGWASGGLGPQEAMRSEEHTSELQSRPHRVCRLLLEKKKK